jgi:hypothetical protein
MDFMQGWIDYILKDELVEARQIVKKESPKSNPLTFDQYDNLETKPEETEPSGSSSSHQSLATSDEFAQSYQKDLIQRIIRSIKSQQRVKSSPSSYIVYYLNSELTNLDSDIQVDLDEFRQDFLKTIPDVENVSPNLIRQKIMSEQSLIMNFFGFIGEYLVAILNEKTNMGFSLNDIDIISQKSNFNPDEFYEQIPIKESVTLASEIRIDLINSKLNINCDLLYPLESFIRYMITPTKKFSFSHFSITIDDQTQNEKDIEAAHWLDMNIQHPSKTWAKLYQAALSRLNPKKASKTAATK